MICDMYPYILYLNYFLYVNVGFNIEAEARRTEHTERISFDSEIRKAQPSALIRTILRVLHARAAI
jgi:hypothetical protein